MKNIAFISIMLIVFHSSSFSQPGTIIYVDDDNTSGVEDGSLQHPFNTVEEGIDAAYISDTVFILNGDYALNQYLKDGLIIQGEDSSATIIHGGFSNSDISMQNYTEVSNLTCDGIYLSMGDGCASIKVKGCHINSAGFSSGSGYHFIIENCTIDGAIGNASGICHLSIRNNYFLDGFISDSGQAPENDEAHVVEGNVINYSSYEPMVRAAIEASTQQITIRDNTIDVTGGASGIIVASGSPTNIIGNQITIHDWTISGNTTGITTSSGIGLVTGNQINGGKIGYHSSGAASLFENNTVKNCHHGFMSSGAEEVKNNEFSNCSGHGVILYGVKGPVSNNNIHHNDSAGIFMIYPCDLGGGEYNGIGKNIIRSNAYFDLFIAYQQTAYDTIFARNNYWDHNTLAGVLSNDINCTDCDSLFIDISGLNPSAVMDQDLSFNLSIYPNPAKDVIKIQCQELHKQAGTLEIYTLDGKSVLKKKMDRGNEIIEINIHDVPTGLYFCKIIIENKSSIKKLIIE